MDLAAVILAGGTAARLDGADKASIEVAGRTLLEHVLVASSAAREVVVVGDEVPTSRPVTFTRESPPLGGPVAGIVAGVAALARRPDLLLVVAVDMPRLTPETVDRLVDAATALPARDGAFLHDDTGRRQLAGVLTRSGIAALPSAEGAHGRSVRSLVSGLDLAAVPAVDDEAADVDSWADLERLR